MPGVYLAAILASAAGILLIDRRWRLAAWAAPGRTLAAVGIGTAFFLAWDAVGIATGVFVKGDSPLLLGIDLAPHLPLEEPVFLAFLSYLALVAWAGVQRVLDRRWTDAAAPTPEASR
jgi:lycopene cyclase domain-containing protein